MVYNRHVEEYTKNEIFLEKCESLKLELLKKRESILLELADNRLSKKVIAENSQESISRLIDLIEYETRKHTSLGYFPGSLCFFYPRLLERRAEKNYYCDVTGKLIRRGSWYLSFRPLIDDITREKTFVLKRTMIANPSYYDFFPSTFSEFETLSKNLTYVYEFPQTDSCYDYYDISTRVGNLSLLELKKRR